MSNIYHDVLILGAGPGGLTAGIYAKRAGVDVALIEKGLEGGVVSSTHQVSNYTGFINISGMELAEKMTEHAKSFNVPFYQDEIKKVYLDGDKKIIECFSSTYECKCLIIALGAEVRKLNVEGERSFIGRGVSYCATCDGRLYKDKTVAVVGDGSIALEDSIYLSGLAKKVYLIHGREEFLGQKFLYDQVLKSGNVEIVKNSTIVSISGGERLENITLLNKEKGENSTIQVDGLFVCVGRGPDTGMLDMDIKKDNDGYIVTDGEMRTSIDGVFAVGDIRTTPLRQIITACSDGAIAATKAFEYLRIHK